MGHSVSNQPNSGTSPAILNVMDVYYLLSNSLFCRGWSKQPFSPLIWNQITGG